MNPLADATVAAPAAPQPLAPQAEVPAPEQTGPQLPEPLDAVARKELPAVAVPPLQPGVPPDPVQSFLVANLDVLPEAGLGWYDTQAKQTVVFNTELLTEEQLAQSEKDGTLASLLQAPAAGAQPGAASAEGTSIPAPAPATPAQKAPKPSAGLQDILANARVKNMQGGPRVSPVQPNPVGQQLARRPV